MGVGKRISYYIEKQGFTKKEFCEKFDIEYNSFVRILAEKRVLGMIVLNQVHTALPKMNVHWALFGEGPMEINEETLYTVNEPMDLYEAKNDVFEALLLKYLDNEKIKRKINEIVHEKK